MQTLLATDARTTGHCISISISILLALASCLVVVLLSLDCQIALTAAAAAYRWLRRCRGLLLGIVIRVERRMVAIVDGRLCRLVLLPVLRARK